VPDLGISISTYSGIPFDEFTRLAREADDAGFAGVFVTEAANDVMMCCQAAARATRRIKIASWIANIYFRAPHLLAAGAQMIQEQSGGRFLLGLGVSHRPALSSLGIEMGNARDRLRRTTEIVRKGLAGEPVSERGMRLRAAAEPVPIYFGALVKETARLAGELADGLMLYLAWPGRMREMIELASREARRCDRAPAEVAITMGLPVYLHEDRARALDAARRGLVFFVALPFYNRILARNGFASEASAVADAVAQRNYHGAAAAITEKLADALALVGPLARCRERLAEYRESGAQLPILVPGQVGDDYLTTVRNTIKLFSKSI
jgi:alkanesulfonate monooxygenase SsuD/methylene tetrahydromethanopterin reductase-like flavin-dependent oxidoreductase (luciferase family)